ncbi:hypothetical protein D3C77_621300 [compost metagenome]
MLRKCINDVQTDIDPRRIVQPTVIGHTVVERVADIFIATIDLIHKKTEPGIFEF